MRKPHDKAFRAFLCLAVSMPDNKEASQLAQDNSLNWEEAAGYAVRSGTSLAFYSNLRRLGLEDRLSERTLEKFSKARQIAVQNNLFFTELFYNLSEKFADAGIRAVPLKAISLSLRTYKEIPRMSSDLDIFVHEADFWKFCRILRKEQFFDKVVIVRGVPLDRGRETPFLRADRAAVDVHYRLFQWHLEKYIFRTDTRDFLSNTVSGEWRGTKVDFLALEDEFFYFLMSLCIEREVGFRYCLDLDLLTRVHGAAMDWQKIKERLDRSAPRRLYFRALRFLRDGLKTPVPGSIFEGEKETGSEPDVRSFFESVVSGKLYLYLLASADNFGKIGFVEVYFKWRLFAAFGWCRSFFYPANFPPRLE